MPSMKKGGIVAKTGPHFLHKGERVIPVSSPKRTTHRTGKSMAHPGKPPAGAHGASKGAKSSDRLATKHVPKRKK
jgi:hypothetical protein